MKRLITIVLMLVLFACSGSGAKELYETAQFEELQNNHKHAVSLYEEIIRDYPKSEYSQKAKERLKALKK
ncbi:MAG: outer membrane protein assembly factor BamD [Deltaproteobacteria bacterium]|nr:outer membrane protein assembly factor BamD [Deltaproteobacteria bacterium]